MGGKGTVDISPGNHAPGIAPGRTFTPIAHRVPNTRFLDGFCVYSRCDFLEYCRVFYSHNSAHWDIRSLFDQSRTHRARFSDLIPEDSAPFDGIGLPVSAKYTAERVDLFCAQYFQTSTDGPNGIYSGHAGAGGNLGRNSDA